MKTANNSLTEFFNMNDIYKMFLTITICSISLIKPYSQVYTLSKSNFKPTENSIYNVNYEVLSMNIDNPLNDISSRDNSEIISKLADPLSFAIPIYLNYPLKNKIQWHQIDSFYYGKLCFFVENALSLNLSLTNFKLPANCEIYLYTNNIITGPITSKENNVNNFWGSSIYDGDKLYLEVKVPVNSFDDFNLIVKYISSGYKYLSQIEGVGFDSSSSCNINIKCELGNGWEEQRNSVALILNEDGSRWCTGALINNACNSDYQFFLTANHCLMDSNCDPENTSLWKFIFKYWSPNCTPNQNGDTSMLYNGATLKSNNQATDFALLEITQNIPNSTEFFYSGWSRNLDITETTLIHHPAGDVMKISRDINTPIQDNINTSSECISNVNSWIIELEYGATNGGSSGCPYYDQNKRIFAQHLGSSAGECLVPNKFGGRFYESWTGGGSNSNRLSNWLDPNNSNPMVINGRLSSDIGGTADLKIINQNASPTSITAGETLTATFKEKNVGTTDAGPNYISFHLSANDILTPGQNGDIFLDEHFNPETLSSNEETSLLTENILIPSTVPTGTYYLFYSADGSQVINECDELNNFATKILNITGITQYADLIIQNPSVSPTSILPGQQGTVYCKNKNQGNVTAGSSITAVWLSQDQDFDGAPTDINLNADMSVPQLTPGQISNLLSHTITIPSGTPCGTWYIMFGADALGQVEEGSNEGNNQFFIPITISCTLICNNDYSCGPPEPPFLTIYSSCINTSCSTIGASPPSPNIPITCGGNQYQSGRYDDDVWFRITPSTTDELTITVTPTSNLNNFDPVIGLYHGNCLTPVQDGCADLYPEGIAEELVFTPVLGNTYLIRVFGYDIGPGYSGNFDICVVTAGDPVPPDLVINNISLSDYTLCDDQDFSASYTIQNVGGVPAPASTVKFYLSTNNSYGSSDDLLGSQSISDLDIGESLNKTKSISIPTGTDPDDWYILVIADANDVVDEGSSGEQNNLDAISIDVLNCGGISDLIINYQSHTPSSAIPGADVYVDITTENIGSADASSCRIGIYISSDAEFDLSEDEYVDDWFQPSLDEGELDERTINFEIPDCNECSIFYIFLVIDYQLVIAESNESNNDDNFQIDVTGCITCSYSVPPTGISFGSSGGSGSFIVTTTSCCPWTATTSQNWVNLFQTTGLGTSTIQYSVDPCNDGSTRTALITVEGQIHEITQSCIETCNSSQSFEWGTHAGSSNLSDEAVDVAIDPNGNLYMTGDIQGAANFGNGIILTTPSTAPDVFVSKHNPSGAIIWAVNYGNTGQEEGYAIETDNDGNIYVMGDFENTVSFDNITLTSNNDHESVFLIKLDTNGEIVWAEVVNQEFTALPGDLKFHDNKIFAFGTLSDYVGNFDEGLFLAEYDLSGNQLNYYTYGSGFYSKVGRALDVDTDGNMIIGGRYLQTITLGTYTLTSDYTLDQNGFIAKINSSGIVLWAKRLHSTAQSEDSFWSFTIDSLNNIYAIATVDSTALYEGINIPLSDGVKVLLLKINPDGAPIWAKASTVGFQGNRQRIMLGNDNDIYFCGSFQDSLQIDSFFVEGQASDAYFARIDASAKISYIRAFGGPNGDNAAGIVSNSLNELFIGGGFRSTMVLDDIVLTSYGSTDIYLAKYVQCDIPPIEVTITGDTVICNGNTSQLSTDYCSEIAYQWYRDSISIPGAINPYHIVTESGLYHVKVSVYPGCDAQSAQIPFYETGSYIFTGNGSWLTASNWINSIIPPTNPPDCYEIIIDHLPGGSCTLYTTTEFTPGINVIVKPGKSFFIYHD